MEAYEEPGMGNGGGHQEPGHRRRPNHLCHASSVQGRLPDSRWKFHEKPEQEYTREGLRSEVKEVKPSEHEVLIKAVGWGLRLEYSREGDKQAGSLQSGDCLQNALLFKAKSHCWDFVMKNLGKGLIDMTGTCLGKRQEDKRQERTPGEVILRGLDLDG